jgi:hypothetical protein
MPNGCAESAYPAALWRTGEIAVLSLLRMKMRLT